MMCHCSLINKIESVEILWNVLDLALLYKQSL